MATDIGPKIGIDGEREFKSQLANINQQIKTLGSEMKAATSAFDENDTSQEKLTKQTSILAQQIDAEKAKMELLADAIARATEKGEENSTATLKLKQQYAEAEATANGLTKQMDDLGKETEDTGEELDETANKAESFGEKFKKGMAVAAGAVAAVTAAVAAVGTAVAKATVDTAYWADDLNTLSVQTGLSTETLQKFQYASERIDVSMETLTGSLSKLTRNMASAQSGSGAAADAFAALGVSVTDANGELRDNEDVFNEVIRALGDVGNETERDALAMSIFGKSAQELNPLIAGGVDVLQELGEEAENAGLILSQDTLDGASKLADALDTLKATGEAAKHELTAGFAEPAAEAISFVTDNIQDLTRAFSTGGFTALSEQLGTSLSNIVEKLSSLLPDVTRFGLNLVQNLAKGILENLPAIVETGIECIQAVLTGLGQALPDLVPAAVDAVLTVAESLIDNADKLVDAGIDLVIGLADGLIKALPKLIAKAPELIVKLVEALIKNAPKLLEAGLQLIVELGKGIVKAFAQLGEVAGRIVGVIIDGVRNVLRRLFDIGAEIINQIWQGIKGAWDTFWYNVKNFFGALVDGVKSLLGIHSPSRVFEGIGKNMALGLGNGFVEQMRTVNQRIDGAIGIPNGGQYTGMVAGGFGSYYTIAGAGNQRQTIELQVNLGGANVARQIYELNRMGSRITGGNMVSIGGLA